MLSHIIVFSSLIITTLILIAEGKNNDTFCNNFQANFNMKSVIGPWYVVAIIPEKLFPDKQDVTCYKVEFSETDEAGLRWLVNTTLKATKVKNEIVDQISGSIVRQRYHSGEPFDVWSKSVDGVNGCFSQVLSLDTNKGDLNNAIAHNAVMQLHLIEANDGSGPFLLQMLWGKLISVVVYRRHVGITQDQLRPVFEQMSRLRGPQRTPKICDIPIKNTLELITNRF